MKILVTGGAGFIASHVADHYIAEGHDVVVVDDLSVGQKANLNPKATFYRVDITDRPALETVFERERPEAINHHAAQKFLRRSVEFPVEDATINILGSLQLLDLAIKYGCQRFIFASTSAVYGEAPSELPYKEHFIGQPIAPYGVSKLAVEHYLHAYAVVAGLSTISLRYANVYGPRQDAHGESGVIAIFTEALLADRTPTINGTGQQTRDYIYIDDVVSANRLALQSKFIGSLNIGTEVEVPLLTIYAQLNRLTGRAITPTHGPAKKGDPERLALAHGKAKVELGWTPHFSLEEGLKMTVESFTPFPVNCDI